MQRERERQHEIELSELHRTSSAFSGQEYLSQTYYVSGDIFTRRRRAFRNRVANNGTQR